MLGRGPAEAFEADIDHCSESGLRWHPGSSLRPGTRRRPSCAVLSGSSAWCENRDLHGLSCDVCPQNLAGWHLPFGEPKNSRHGKLDRLIAVGACVIPGSHQDDVRSESHRQIDIEGASVSLPVRVYGIDVNMPSSYSVYR